MRFKARGSDDIKTENLKLPEALYNKQQTAQYCQTETEANYG